MCRAVLHASENGLCVQAQYVSVPSTCFDCSKPNKGSSGSCMLVVKSVITGAAVAAYAVVGEVRSSIGSCIPVVDEVRSSSGSCMPTVNEGTR